MRESRSDVHALLLEKFIHLIPADFVELSHPVPFKCQNIIHVRVDFPLADAE